jgi:hypothetical protein
MVQLLQCETPRHDNSPLDGWLNFCQADIQRVEESEILALSGECALDTVDRVIIKNVGVSPGLLQSLQLLLKRDVRNLIAAWT